MSNKTSDSICTAAYPDYVNNRIGIVTSGKSETDPDITLLYLQIINQDGTPYTTSYTFSDKNYNHLLFPNIKMSKNYIIMT